MTDVEQLARTPFFYYFKKHRRVFAIGVGSLFLTNLLDCLYPLAMKTILDLVEQGHYGRDLLPSVGVFMLIMVGVSIFRLSWRWHFGRFQHDVAEELRNRLFQKFTTLGASFYQKNPVGQLMSLISNDVNSFRMAVGGGVLVSLDAIFLIGIIVPIMLSISVAWTWRTLIFLPLLPPLIQRLERLIHERYKEQQQRFSELSGSAQEIVSGVRVIKSYAQEPAQTEHFNVISRQFALACNRSARVDALFQPTMEFAVSSGCVILLWLGSPDVVAGAISIGSFYAFQRYIHKMIWPMTAIGMGVSMVQQGRASMDRISELLTTATDIPDLGTVRIEAFENLDVRNLTFTYPGQTEPALQNISFQVKSGERLGVMGAVGAGKSTLVQLLARLYPVPRGMIFINGYDINDIQLASLWNLIAMVPQQAFLFSETVSDNLSLGVEFAAEETVLRQYARAVNIDDEILNLDQGYGSYLGERGVNLSGGQKQRLTIARALIRRTPLVILDDSLSAVDVQTERNIMSQLEKRSSSTRTTILVSHRLAPLMKADRILVLHGGKIEAQGSASELQRISPTFQRLVELQSEVVT